MKDLLKEKYKIEIDNYYVYKDGIIFFLDGFRYYFVKHDYDDEFFKVLVELIQELKIKKVYLHEFVLDKWGNVNSDGYCLMKILTFGNEITEYEMKRFYELRNFNDEFYKQYVSLTELWYKKLDYLEYQVSELSNKMIINNSIDFYLGIAEEILQFLSNYNNASLNSYLSLAHRKLENFNVIDFYNPLNIIIDIYTRDLGLYVKYSCDYEYLYQFLQNAPHDYTYYYLYARLILPSDYFNLLEDILLDDKKERELSNYINKYCEYEDYIKCIDEMFGFSLFPWIKKSN